MVTTRETEMERIGNCAMDAIRCMSDALECDYDRLEELREQLSDGLLDRDDERQELCRLEAAAGNDCSSREDAEQQIHEDALSVEVRSDWTCLGEPLTTAEFCLLLTTGGPAVRIVGDLDEHGEPSRPRLEVQNWGTPWTEHPTDQSDDAALLAYARCFYFGD